MLKLCFKIFDHEFIFALILFVYSLILLRCFRGILIISYLKLTVNIRKEFIHELQYYKAQCQLQLYWTELNFDVVSLLKPNPGKIPK